MSQHKTLKEIIEEAVVKAYQETGSKEEAAKRLKIGRATVYRILQRSGVPYKRGSHQ